MRDESRSAEEIRREMIDTQLDTLDVIDRGLAEMDWPTIEGGEWTPTIGAIFYLAGVVEAQTRVQIVAARIAATVGIPIGYWLPEGRHER